METGKNGTNGPALKMPECPRDIRYNQCVHARLDGSCGDTENATDCPVPNQFFRDLNRAFPSEEHLNRPLPSATMPTAEAIPKIFDSLKELVKEKNRRYGDSALTPPRVFSKADAEAGILVRLDDKLGRIKNNDGILRKNDVADLIGYLALLSAARGWLDFSDLID